MTSLVVKPQQGDPLHERSHEDEIMQWKQKYKDAKRTAKNLQHHLLLKNAEIQNLKLQLEIAKQDIEARDNELILLKDRLAAGGHDAKSAALLVMQQSDSLKSQFIAMGAEGPRQALNAQSVKKSASFRDARSYHSEAGAMLAGAKELRRSQSIPRKVVGVRVSAAARKSSLGGAVFASPSLSRRASSVTTRQQPSGVRQDASTSMRPTTSSEAAHYSPHAAEVRLASNSHSRSNSTAERVTQHGEQFSAGTPVSMFSRRTTTAEPGTDNSHFAEPPSLTLGSLAPHSAHVLGRESMPRRAAPVNHTDGVVASGVSAPQKSGKLGSRLKSLLGFKSNKNSQESKTPMPPALAAALVPGTDLDAIGPLGRNLQRIKEIREQRESDRHAAVHPPSSYAMDLTEHPSAQVSQLMRDDQVERARALHQQMYHEEPDIPASAPGLWPPTSNAAAHTAVQGSAVCTLPYPMSSTAPPAPPMPNSEVLASMAGSASNKHTRAPSSTGFMSAATAVDSTSAPVAMAEPSAGGASIPSTMSRRGSESSAHCDAPTRRTSWGSDASPMADNALLAMAVSHNAGQRASCIILPPGLPKPSPAGPISHQRYLSAGGTAVPPALQKSISLPGGVGSLRASKPSNPNLEVILGRMRTPSSGAQAEDPSKTSWAERPDGTLRQCSEPSTQFTTQVDDHDLVMFEATVRTSIVEQFVRLRDVQEAEAAAALAADGLEATMPSCPQADSLVMFDATMPASMAEQAAAEVAAAISAAAAAPKAPPNQDVSLCISSPTSAGPQMASQPAHQDCASDGMAPCGSELHDSVVLYEETLRASVAQKFAAGWEQHMQQLCEEEEEVPEDFSDGGIDSYESLGELDAGQDADSTSGEETPAKHSVGSDADVEANTPNAAVVTPEESTCASNTRHARFCQQYDDAVSLTQAAGRSTMSPAASGCDPTSLTGTASRPRTTWQLQRATHSTGASPAHMLSRTVQQPDSSAPPSPLTSTSPLAQNSNGQKNVGAGPASAMVLTTSGNDSISEVLADATQGSLSTGGGLHDAQVALDVTCGSLSLVSKENPAATEGVAASDCSQSFASLHNFSSHASAAEATLRMQASKSTAAKLSPAVGQPLPQPSLHSSSELRVSRRVLSPTPVLAYWQQKEAEALSASQASSASSQASKLRGSLIRSSHAASSTKAKHPQSRTSQLCVGKSVHAGSIHSVTAAVSSQEGSSMSKDIPVLKQEDHLVSPSHTSKSTVTSVSSVSSLEEVVSAIHSLHQQHTPQKPVPPTHLAMQSSAPIQLQTLEAKMGGETPTSRQYIGSSSDDNQLQHEQLEDPGAIDVGLESVPPSPGFRLHHLTAIRTEAVSSCGQQSQSQSDGSISNCCDDDCSESNPEYRASMEPPHRSTASPGCSVTVGALRASGGSSSSQADGQATQMQVLLSSADQSVRFDSAPPHTWPGCSPIHVEPQPGEEDYHGEGDKLSTDGSAWNEHELDGHPFVEGHLPASPDVHSQYSSDGDDSCDLGLNSMVRSMAVFKSRADIGSLPSSPALMTGKAGRVSSGACSPNVRAKRELMADVHPAFDVCAASLGKAHNAPPVDALQNSFASPLLGALHKKAALWSLLASGQLDRSQAIEYLSAPSVYQSLAAEGKVETGLERHPAHLALELSVDDASPLHSLSHALGHAAEANVEPGKVCAGTDALKADSEPPSAIPASTGNVRQMPSAGAVHTTPHPAAGQPSAKRQPSLPLLKRMSSWDDAAPMAKRPPSEFLSAVASRGASFTATAAAPKSGASVAVELSEGVSIRYLVQPPPSVGEVNGANDVLAASGAAEDCSKRQHASTADHATGHPARQRTSSSAVASPAEQPQPRALSNHIDAVHLPTHGVQAVDECADQDEGTGSHSPEVLVPPQSDRHHIIASSCHLITEADDDGDADSLSASRQMRMRITLSPAQSSSGHSRSSSGAALDATAKSTWHEALNVKDATEHYLELVDDDSEGAGSNCPSPAQSGPHSSQPTQLPDAPVLLHGLSEEQAACRLSSPSRPDIEQIPDASCTIITGSRAPVASMVDVAQPSLWSGETPSVLPTSSGFACYDILDGLASVQSNVDGNASRNAGKTGLCSGESPSGLGSNRGTDQRDVAYSMMLHHNVLFSAPFATSATLDGMSATEDGGSTMTSNEPAAQQSIIAHQSLACVAAADTNAAKALAEGHGHGSATDNGSQDNSKKQPSSQPPAADVASQEISGPGLAAAPVPGVLGPLAAIVRGGKTATPDSSPACQALPVSAKSSPLSSHPLAMSVNAATAKMAQDDLHPPLAVHVATDTSSCSTIGGSSCADAEEPGAAGRIQADINAQCLSERQSDSGAYLAGARDDRDVAESDVQSTTQQMEADECWDQGGPGEDCSSPPACMPSFGWAAVRQVVNASLAASQVATTPATVAQQLQATPVQGQHRRWEGVEGNTAQEADACSDGLIEAPFETSADYDANSAASQVSSYSSAGFLPPSMVTAVRISQMLPSRFLTLTADLDDIGADIGNEDQYASEVADSIPALPIDAQDGPCQATVYANASAAGTEGQEDDTLSCQSSALGACTDPAHHGVSTPLRPQLLEPAIPSTTPVILHKAAASSSPPPSSSPKALNWWQGGSPAASDCASTDKSHAGHDEQAPPITDCEASQLNDRHRREGVATHRMHHFDEEEFDDDSGQPLPLNDEAQQEESDQWEVHSVDTSNNPSHTSSHATPGASGHCIDVNGEILNSEDEQGASGDMQMYSPNSCCSAQVGQESAAAAAACSQACLSGSVSSAVPCSNAASATSSPCTQNVSPGRDGGKAGLAAQQAAAAAHFQPPREPDAVAPVPSHPAYPPRPLGARSGSLSQTHRSSVCNTQRSKRSAASEDASVSHQQPANSRATATTSSAGFYSDDYGMSTYSRAPALPLGDVHLEDLEREEGGAEWSDVSGECSGSGGRGGTMSTPSTQQATSMAIGAIKSGTQQAAPQAPTHVVVPPLRLNPAALDRALTPNSKKVNGGRRGQPEADTPRLVAGGATPRQLQARNQSNHVIAPTAQSGARTPPQDAGRASSGVTGQPKLTESPQQARRRGLVQRKTGTSEASPLANAPQAQAQRSKPRTSTPHQKPAHSSATQHPQYRPVQAVAWPLAHATVGPLTAARERTRSLMDPSSSGIAPMISLPPAHTLASAAPQSSQRMQASKAGKPPSSVAGASSIATNHQPPPRQSDSAAGSKPLFALPGSHALRNLTSNITSMLPTTLFGSATTPGLRQAECTLATPQHAFSSSQLEPFSDVPPAISASLVDASMRSSDVCIPPTMSASAQAKRNKWHEQPRGSLDKFVGSEADEPETSGRLQTIEQGEPHEASPALRASAAAVAATVLDECEDVLLGSICWGVEPGGVDAAATQADGQLEAGSGQCARNSKRHGPCRRADSFGMEACVSPQQAGLDAGGDLAGF